MSDLVFVSAIYIVGVVGWILVRFAEVEFDPSTMPGGGRPAIVFTSILWPLVALLALVALVTTVAS